MIQSHKHARNSNSEGELTENVIHEVKYLINN